MMLTEQFFFLGVKLLEFYPLVLGQHQQKTVGGRLCNQADGFKINMIHLGLIKIDLRLSTMFIYSDMNVG